MDYQIGRKKLLQKEKKRCKLAPLLLFLSIFIIVLIKQEILSLQYLYTGILFFWVLTLVCVCIALRIKKLHCWSIKVFTLGI